MVYSRGLAGVIAGETAISNVEGEIGRLSYRGYAIEELVQQDYLTVMWLVIFGELPYPQDKARLATYLAEQGGLGDDELKLLSALPKTLHPMRMLQSMIPLLPIAGGSGFDGLDAAASPGLHVIAKLPALIAAFRQLKLGNQPVAFDASAGYLTNFLTMFTGAAPSADQVDALKVVQILQMEHSYNAGTFTSLVVGSTLAPVDAVLSAAVGALSGRLHGGADEAALSDAKRVGSPAAAAAYIEDLLARKGKLMGMGHREYRKVDPRARIVKHMAGALCKGTGFENDFATLNALEMAFNQQMRVRGKEVRANLEFYKGAVYEVLGIPPEFFTSVFAMSRAIGWLAHFIESRRDNRIIRPKAAYVGAALRRIVGPAEPAATT